MIHENENPARVSPRARAEFGFCNGAMPDNTPKLSDAATDFVALYQQMLGEHRGVGAGMRGPGIGDGGTAPRDDSLASGFKPEQSRSALTGGKMLLEWKTSEVSDAGTASKNYADAIKNVKQGVSEAILQEQVPPGYHEAIKRYFDTIEKPAKP